MCEEPALAARHPAGAPTILPGMELQPDSRLPAVQAMPPPLPESAPPRPESMPDENELRLRGWIAQIARGDEQALGRLYDVTLGRVYGLALRITRNPQAAEEVAEDVYWQVWRQALRFDATRGHAMGWLLTMTRSRALDNLRRADEAQPHPEPESLIDGEPSEAGDPQDLLDATQRDHLLHAALAKLDALPRQLLALAFFRGLTHEEIAAQSALPLGTVKSQIRRALAALKNVLAPHIAARESTS